MLVRGTWWFHRYNYNNCNCTCGISKFPVIIIITKDTLQATNQHQTRNVTVYSEILIYSRLVGLLFFFQVKLYSFVYTCMDSPSKQCLGFSTTTASTPAMTPDWFRDTSLPKLDKLVLLTASRGRLCRKTVYWTSPFMTSKSHVMTDCDSLIVTKTCYMAQRSIKWISAWMCACQVAPYGYSWHFRGILVAIVQPTHPIKYVCTYVLSA